MNSAILIGRLTRDPDVRYTSDQMAVARFTLAIDRPVKKGIDKQVDYPQVVCFGKTAEIIEKYVSKGKQIAVQGRIQTGSYKNKEGNTVYTTEVVADRVKLLGSNNNSDDGNNGAVPVISEPAPDGFEALDDELPF